MTSSFIPQPSPFDQPALPRGLVGLLAISFLTAGRGTVTGYCLGMLCLGAWIACLASGAAPLLILFTAAIVLPAGLLVAPVVGVLQGQRLPADYRALDLRSHLRLWLLAGRSIRSWPLPGGVLSDPAIRRHARLVADRAERIAPLARGARAAVAAGLRDALRGVEDPVVAAALIDETVERVTRWEAAAEGLPPVGGKLYLRHDPLGERAREAARSAARLGVPSDTLNYFYRGQVLLLPPARSHRTLAALIDALLAAGVARPGRPLPLQIAVQGALGDEAKLIAVGELLASGLDLAIEGPERRGDEGNLIAKGKNRPEWVAGGPGHDRTDFLFSLVWMPVEEIAAAGYADQHQRDLRVVQTLAAALLAARRPGPRPPSAARLAAVWEEYARDLSALCIGWGAADAVLSRYEDVPFAVVRPAIEQLLACKAGAPDLCHEARRLRSCALTLVELTLAVEPITAAAPIRHVRLSRSGVPDQEATLRAGLRRTRRALRRGARVAVITRDDATLRILLEEPAEEG